MSLRWECISHKPTQWASRIGRVIREPDGRWRWFTGGMNGAEPSRVEAINQVMREFDQNACDMPTVSCDKCKYESPEERYTDAEWWWEYHCNLADGRKIERKDGELHPDWCPLICRNNRMKGKRYVDLSQFGPLDFQDFAMNAEHYHIATEGSR